MKRNAKLFALLALATVVACDVETPTELAPSPSFSTVSASSDAIPDRYIVRLSDDVPSAAAASAAMMRGLRGEVHFTYENVFKGFAVTLPAQALNGLRRNPLIAAIEQDAVVTLDATQSGATWGLDRIDARSLPLDGVYSYGPTGAGVDAYIIDTGILSGHIDFGGRVQSGYDAVTIGGNAEDCDGHGTHFAGTVGGTEWGVAKEVNLIPVRVLDCNGSGSFSGVIAGMDWVAGQASGPSVANMSLGGGASSSVDAAVSRMVDAGVTVVVAAGNSNADACNSSPARAAAAITVGATTSSDARASYSNFGSCLDIFAPGSGITSAWYTSATSTNTISGTSMASPHVAGAAALWLEENSSWTPAEVVNALTNAATEGAVTNADGSVTSGRGRNRTTTTIPSANLLLYVDPGMGGGGGGGNSAPSASFTYSCLDLTCDFAGSGSDSDGTVESYAWSFGATGAEANNVVFGDYGSFPVTLTVTDNEGATGSSTQTVTLANPNPPAITLDLVRQYKQRGTPFADFTYSGTTNSVDLVGPSGVFGTASGGEFTVQFPKGGGTYDIQVCDTGTDNCSNTVTVAW